MGPVEKEVAQTTSSLSSFSTDSEDDVEKKKQPDVVVPTDVEKVIEVEEVTKQETPSETPIIEKITGIFKRDQGSSSSSSDSEDEKEDVNPVPCKEEVVHTKSESSSSSSSSEDKEIVVVDEVPKQPTPSDKTVTEKITGIFKRDRSTSSSSSDSVDGKEHEIPLPVEKEVVHTTSSSSSSFSDSEDDVEKKKQPDVVVPTDVEK